ncbi:Uncharacterised protein [Halioglobus japonicus]|nr:Uncharacterised protein [Halioglobus japonicus]
MATYTYTWLDVDRMAIFGYNIYITVMRQPNMHRDFYIKIYAPDALESLGSLLPGQAPEFEVSESEGNGRSYLRVTRDDSLEWEMSFTDSDYLIAKGLILGDIDKGKAVLFRLELALIETRYPYELGFGERGVDGSECSSHLWEGHHDA